MPPPHRHNNNNHVVDGAVDAASSPASQFLEAFPASAIFCNSAVLGTLQTSPFRPFPDSKTLVDLPLLHPPHISLPRLRPAAPPALPPAAEYIALLAASFATRPDYLPDCGPLTLAHHPADHTEQPPAFLTPPLAAAHPQLAAFVNDLKARWPSLCRRHHPRLLPPGPRTGERKRDDDSRGGDCDATADVAERTSLIGLPHPFFVPGGRFRECYYWDTLWILRGLLVCDMLQSALGAVRNLVALALRFQFIPNGTRVYYLTRSQPPVLADAIRITRDALPPGAPRVNWLRECLPALDVELEFFHVRRSVAAVAPGSALAARVLSLYFADTSDPRPESFAEDVRTAAQAAAKYGRAAGEVYTDIAAGAESGWDFSSRWMIPTAEGDMSTACLRTTNVIPVCLNSFLLHAERLASQFHAQLAAADGSDGPPDGEHARKSAHYKEMARLRQQAMTDVMWCPKACAWFDVAADTGLRTPVISAACLFPAWAGAPLGPDDTPENARRLVIFLTRTSGLLSVGGLATTTSTASREQWDWPNSWPPLVDLAAEAMENVHARFPHAGAHDAAREVARRFVRAAFRGWRRDGNMHEKYDCTRADGSRGEGGEYEPQTGFGWTNGALLWLLRKYAGQDATFWEGME